MRSWVVVDIFGCGGCGGVWIAELLLLLLFVAVLPVGVSWDQPLALPLEVVVLMTGRE